MIIEIIDMVKKEPNVKMNKNDKSILNFILRNFTKNLTLDLIENTPFKQIWNAIVDKENTYKLLYLHTSYRVLKIMKECVTLKVFFINDEIISYIIHYKNKKINFNYILDIDTFPLCYKNMSKQDFYDYNRFKFNKKSSLKYDCLIPIMSMQKNTLICINNKDLNDIQSIFEIKEIILIDYPKKSPLKKITNCFIDVEKHMIQNNLFYHYFNNKNTIILDNFGEVKQKHINAYINKLFDNSYLKKFQEYLNCDTINKKLLNDALIDFDFLK